MSELAQELRATAWEVADGHDHPPDTAAVLRDAADRLDQLERIVAKARDSTDAE